MLHFLSQNNNNKTITIVTDKLGKRKETFGRSEYVYGID